MIELSKITAVAGTQAREKINQDTVDSYAEHLADGGIFPPIILFFDGCDYWLADGWHRYLAHKAIGCLTIHEDIRIGTRRDAQKYSLGANSSHGLQRTNADKRKAVNDALADVEWAKLTTREIANLCAVSNALVSEMQRGITPQQKTEKNNTRPNKSVLTVNRDVDDAEQKQQVNQAQKGGRPASVVEKAPEKEPEPEYTALDAAHDQITELQDIIAKGVAELSQDEQAAATDYIDDMRAEIKTLARNLAAVTSSRDTLMRENAELKKQLAAQRREIAKLKNATA